MPQEAGRGQERLVDLLGSSIPLQESYYAEAGRCTVGRLRRR